MSLFEKQITSFREFLWNTEELSAFQQLPESLIAFLFFEKVNLFMVSETRMVSNDQEEMVFGYAHHYDCQDDVFHPKELLPYHLKGYWIPESEGKYFKASETISCPFVRKGHNEEEFLFLIHPKAEPVFAPLIEKYRDQEVLIPAFSLSSFRSLLVAVPRSDIDGLYSYALVKVSLDEKIGGVQRLLSLKECACSVGNSAVLKHRFLPLSFFYDDVAFVPHPHFLDPHHTLAIERGAGMIYRSFPDELRFEEGSNYVIPFFALFANQGELLNILIQESGLSPTEFIRDVILKKLAKIFIELIFRQQISIEAHGQNLLLIVSHIDSQKIHIDFLYRDMGGVNCFFSDEDLRLLPKESNQPDYYYLQSHFQDTAKALEFFTATILFNLTKTCFQSDRYAAIDPNLADWKEAMIERKFSANWMLPGVPHEHQQNLTKETFYRYGYFEKMFGHLLLEAMLDLGVFQQCTQNGEYKTFHFFQRMLEPEDHPYDPFLETEWFKQLILQTYPAYLQNNYHHTSWFDDQVVDQSFIELLIDEIHLVLKTNKNLPRPLHALSADLFQDLIEKRILPLLHTHFISCLVQKNAFLFAMHEQVLNGLKHLNLICRRVDPRYPHPPTFQGPYPFKPTIHALKSVLILLTALQVSLGQIGDSLFEERVEPIDNAVAEIIQRHSLLIRKIIDDPISYYRAFKFRIESEGLNAKFEEFESLLSFLEFRLQQSIFHQNAVCSAMCAFALREVQEVKEKGYPYLDTLDAVEASLGFLDVFERGKFQQHPPSKLFHSYQYRYYSSYLKEELPNHLIFPTLYNLGATDLLKVRGVPLGFLGVNGESVWVDGYWQTPLEFWFHDVNHTRRMWQFFQGQAAISEMTIPVFMQKSHHYVSSFLIPLIKIDKSDPADVANQKRMIKIILFEILHEDAFAATPEVIQKALEDNEAFSAVEFIEHNRVSYTMEKSGAKLEIIHWKLAGNFYDTEEFRNELIVSPEFRSKEFVAKAASLLIAKL